jgi:outer membrane protein
MRCLLVLLGGAAAAVLWWPASARGAEALSMDAAVSQALRANPTLEVARRELNVGLLEADRARPAFRPEVSATASQFVRTPRVDLPGRPDAVVLPNAASRLEIGLRQPVFQFGAGGAPGQRAAALAAAARAEFQRAELDLALETREAFLAVVRADALAGVAEEGLALARRQIDLTRTLITGGVLADGDLLEAQRAEAEAESGALMARNGAALARANLNRVLGRPLDTEVQPIPPGALPADPGDTAALTAAALARRPEILALRHNLEAAAAGIRLAKAARQPRVSLEVAYALQTETALVPRSGLAAGVSITLPLFDTAAHRHTVREAEERLAQLRSALAAREQGVALEIERQRLALGEARARREVSRRGMAAAEQAHEITRLRLERGRATAIELANARLGLTRSRADGTAAEHDMHLARVRLDRALGL